MILLYEYDAWGNCTITSGADDPIVVANPFRYRRYYYDTETGLYYCNARYYDPQTGRFISADSTDYLDPNHMNGMNLYAYCINNPVMYSDPAGRSVTAILIGLGLVALAGGIAGGVIGYENGKRGRELAKSIVIGVGLGLAIGGAVVSTTAVIAGAIGGITATVFGGVATAKAFAIGALAFDFFAYFIAPFFGVEVQGIEYDPMSSPLDDRVISKPQYIK